MNSNLVMDQVQAFSTYHTSQRPLFKVDSSSRVMHNHAYRTRPHCIIRNDLCELI